MGMPVPNAASPSDDLFHLRRDESEFISATRLFMITGLVFHHMFGLPDSAYYPRNPLTQFSALVPDLINGLAHMSFMAAVPALSVISGFLFFRRPEVSFGKLLKKRFFSVALPSWIWCLFWLGFGFVLYEVGKGPGWFEWADYQFEDFGLLALANGVIGIDQRPWAFQFWFIHDLILTLALSPIIFWLLKRLGGNFVAAMLVVWVIGYAPPPFFSLNVLAFFIIGAYLGLPDGPRLSTALQSLERVGPYVTPLFVAALMVRQFSFVFGEYEAHFLGHHYLCALRILGVISFSHVLYRLVLGNSAFKDLLIRYSGYSFFIFATHYPIIECIKIISRRIPESTSQIGYFVLLVAIPGITLALCILWAKLLEHFAPSLFRLLNGGRAGAQAPRARPVLARATG
jgi:hypothetical protein